MTGSIFESVARLAGFFVDWTYQWIYGKEPFELLLLARNSVSIKILGKNFVIILQTTVMTNEVEVLKNICCRLCS